MTSPPGVTTCFAPRPGNLSSLLYLTHPDELASWLGDQPSYRTDQLRRWLYRNPVLRSDDMTNLPAGLRRDLPLWPFAVVADQAGDGGKTRKWLFEAPDGAQIESVLMGYPKRATLCLSSQAGCALACTFCATGQFGFERHLEPGEIVAQVAYVRAFLRQVGMPDTPDRLTNVVFMGMGEPLANYRRVREAIRRMIEEMGMSPRSLTVSTVGMVPGIRRLAEEGWPLNLAISLHAADDELRSRLVPLNRRYQIEDLVAAAIGYFEKTGRRVSIEWTMMDGVNDTDEQATKLAEIARRIRAHVNLIPLNPTAGTDHRTSPAVRMDRFVQILGYLGVPATIRDTRGRDIDAACGQLRARSLQDGQAVQVRVAGTT